MALSLIPAEHRREADRAVAASLEASRAALIFARHGRWTDALEQLTQASRAHGEACAHLESAGGRAAAARHAADRIDWVRRRVAERLDAAGAGSPSFGRIAALTHR